MVAGWWLPHDGVHQESMVDTKDKPGNKRRRGAERLRRAFSVEYKQRVVGLTLAPEASVARVALAHGLNTNLLFKWRREHLRAQAARTSTTAAMLPVVMAQDGPESTAALPLPRPNAAGVIELELPGGRMRLKGAVDITVVGALVRMLRA